MTKIQNLEEAGFDSLNIRSLDIICDLEFDNW